MTDNRQPASRERENHTLQRLDSFVMASFGKRLTYKELIA